MDLRTLQKFEIRELCFFVALAEALHYGRAAERLGMEKSPLSHAIILMERKLGVRLFERTRLGTRLSAAGEDLLPIARRLLGQADQANQIVLAALTGRKGRLRVAICENVASPRIAELVKQSREEDTDVELIVEQHSLAQQIGRLRDGVLDLGLAASASDEPTGADPEIEALVLSRDSLMVALPLQHILLAAPVVQVLHANMGPFFLVDCCSLDTRVVGEIILPTEDAQPKIEAAASLGMLLTRVAAGDGIGLVSSVQAQGIARPDIAFLPLESRRARITTYLLRRQGEESVLATRFTKRARRLHVRPLRPA